MFLPNRLFFVSQAAILFVLLLFCGSGSAVAKHSGANLALHANSNAGPADIGLPGYPGATPFKKDSTSDSAANLGFTFGDFHFGIKVAEFTTSDSPVQVLAYYRRPLSRYGDVLECNHGKPVGKLTSTPSGLTCSDEHGGHIQINGSASPSDNYELRAGSPHRFRIVGIDDSHTGATHFGLVYVELPKDTGNHRTTD